MSEKNNIHEYKTARNKKLEHRIAALGWGVFFIWTGVALLAHIGWGVGLMGVAILILGGQVLRYYSGLRVVGFWIVMGSLFFLGGIWKLFDVQLDLIPILCIGVGAALLLSVLVCKAGIHKNGQSPTLPEIKEK
jgi:predicted benzoate:H+ symporter BenE